ncbi:ion transporter [Acuticoccus sediminis]|uniref:Ion transporter n=1 Tax=Acuticoccus sediminis TaxID=2184697 RepID=A0A8B2NM34_9HYPH|nr:ion transporter [Acuticoccus sediminis]RAI00677.1 ion transporter [Acuticoccus sediminis]
MTWGPPHSVAPSRSGGSGVGTQRQEENLEEVTDPAVESDRRSRTRRRIQAILDGYDPVFGRAVAFAIQALIIISVVSIAVETMKGIPAWLHRALIIEEWIVIALFSVEYVLRVYAAPRRLGYVFSFYGIVDFMSVAPTLLLMGYDVRSLRALRAFRILRLFKLMRYVRAFDRLGRAVARVSAELIVFAGIAIVVLYLCASAIYYLERDAQPEAFSSIPQAMWWAIVTLTTVGYGDVYPVTVGGRIFTGIVLILALGVIAVPTGLVATALSEEVHSKHPHGAGPQGALGASDGGEGGSEHGHPAGKPPRSGDAAPAGSEATERRGG